MRLSVLLREVAVLNRWGSDGDPIISGVTADSRQAQGGRLFVALRGECHDGHAFIYDAVQRGAAAVVVERDCTSLSVGSLCVPALQVANTRRALSLIAATFYGYPAKGARLVGVTGTVGKTSTSLILTHLLRSSGERAGVIGSLGIDDGIHRAASPLTTPDPVVLHRSLESMRRNGIHTVTVEVSSHSLVQQRVYGLRFATGVFTNILPLEHSDFHPTFEEYVATKAEMLRQMTPGGVVVYNGDSPRLARVIPSYSGPKISFGIGRHTDVRVDQVVTQALGSTFQVHCRRPLPTVRGVRQDVPSISICLPLLGRHNVMNALAAIAAGLALGLTPTAIRHAMPRLKLFQRRMEVIANEDLTVIDDTVGHPASIDRLFEAVQQLQYDHLVVVVAIRGGRGAPINAANARHIASWQRILPVRALIVTSSQDVTDSKDSVYPHEEQAFTATLSGEQAPFYFTSDLEDACRAALEVARAGDLLILMGAQGMDRGASFIRDCLRSRRHAHHLRK